MTSEFYSNTQNTFYCINRHGSLSRHGYNKLELNTNKYYKVVGLAIINYSKLYYTTTK